MKINSTPSPTDDHLSFAATEFVWATAEPVSSHEDIGPRIIEVLRECGARRILDLGCGNGAFTNRLQAEGFGATGCDVSESGIALARKHYPAPKFFLQDLSRPLIEDHTSAYDAVVSIEVVEHLLLPRLMITSAYEALRPGGVLIVTTPFHGYWKNLALAAVNQFDSHWHPLRDFGHVKFFSKKTLCALLEEQDLAVEQFFTVGRIPAFAKTMIAVARKPE